METIVYLIRHSEKYREVNFLEDMDSFQLINEKTILSVNGEKKAKKLSENEELKDIDVVISSNYSRSMQTAKYIADKNNKELNIISSFGERELGINSDDEVDDDILNKQIKDINYKIKNGESRQDVIIRMYNALIKVIKKYEGKKIVIVSHATAMLYLLMYLTNSTDGNVYFDNKQIIDINYKWDAPELFKLIFKKEKLISLKKIKI